jgi:hypothetical protein
MKSIPTKELINTLLNISTNENIHEPEISTNIGKIFFEIFSKIFIQKMINDLFSKTKEFLK